jgi:uncharacterized Zn finger protein (UPF0148 family)
VAILKTRCPECDAGLKSPTGFAVGQTVCCPKCETYFAVEEPEDEEEPKAAKKPVKAAALDNDEDDDRDDEAPKKKKRKRRDDDDEDEPARSYKNSPVRFVILGVLIVVMLVLGYMLYEKRKGERAMNAGSGPAPADDDLGPIPGRATGPAAGGPRPNANPNPVVPKPPAGKPPAGPDPIGGLFGGGPAHPALFQRYKLLLVGTWVADLGGGVTEELTYATDGTFTATLSGATAMTVTGKYVATEAVGKKGLKLQLDTAAGARTVTVTFEGDEMEHPSLQPGVTASFRRK